MSQNPYAPPSSAAGPNFNLGQPTSETIRRLHLKHEASVKSIGTLYFLSGLIVIGIGILPLFITTKDLEFTPALSAVFAVIGLLKIWLAIGIRKLKKGAKVPAIIVATFGLLGFPLGTLISAYFLYLLCSQKGTMVFSDAYAQVIAETPHIKYRTSVLVWILLALLIGLVGLLILLGLSAGKTA